MNRRHWHLALASVFALAAASTLTAWIVVASADDQYLVSIPASMAVRLTPAKVVEIATGRLDSMETMTNPDKQTRRDLISVSASLGTNVPEIVGRPEGVETGTEGRVYWVVRAEGTFTTFRGRLREPIVATSGYILIDDGTGLVVGMGWP
ncbi:MAG: hypothetical protein ACRDHD_04495 [Candidatus Limnocylindria bacterium]